MASDGRHGTTVVHRKLMPLYFNQKQLSSTPCDGALVCIEIDMCIFLGGAKVRFLYSTLSTYVT
jgi:hypothetical protein